LLKYLLGGTGTLTLFASLREAADHDGLGDADTVVLDLPGDAADTTVAQVRHRYRGELIVLAERGHASPDAAPDPAWTLLERPFSALALGTALGLPGFDTTTETASKAERHPLVAGPQTGGLAQPTPADRKAAPRRAPLATAGAGRVGLVERVSRALVALTRGWQSRRRVRVAGLSAFTLVAFTVAFVLAAQGRCGPGCDALGTGFSPAPTIAPSRSSAPSTTGPKLATTTTVTQAGPAGTGAFWGATGGRLATATTGRQATTTTGKPSPVGGPGPTTPTTRPPTTTAPTTTTPTTTTPTTTTPTTTTSLTTGGA
jgi:hypothetical protein